MSWVDVTAQLNAQLNLSSTVAPVLLGAKNLKGTGAPPRVVIVPTRDRFGPSQNIGADPPQILTCFAGAEVHCWAADVPTTEALRNAVLCALMTLAEGSFDLEGPAGWSEKDIEGAQVLNGSLYIFSLHVQMPVTDAPYTTAEVDSIPETSSMTLPGSDTPESG
jgi:hypothetical protein